MSRLQGMRGQRFRLCMRWTVVCAENDFPFLGLQFSGIGRRLATGASHVPYRNSTLTYLLQDCLSGDGKALMFVNLILFFCFCFRGWCTAIKQSHTKFSPEPSVTRAIFRVRYFRGDIVNV